MRPTSEARPWTPLLPTYAAAAVLFWSFDRPQSWAWPSGERVSLAEGSLQVTWRGTAPAPLLGGIPILGNLFGMPPPRFTNWWFTFDLQGANPGVAIPLWAPVLVLGVVGAAMRRRSERKGRCPECGYDLTGLPMTPETGVCCPECGVHAPLSVERDSPSPAGGRL